MPDELVMDEMVATAYEYFEEGSVLRDHVRNALEAIAPSLIACGKVEGLREAEKIAHEQRCERDTPWDLACVTIAKAIRARADALATKGET